jgi:hypothetical protein
MWNLANGIFAVRAGLMIGPSTIILSFRRLGQGSTAKVSFDPAEPREGELDFVRNLFHEASVVPRPMSILACFGGSQARAAAAQPLATYALTRIGWVQIS